MAEEPAAVKSYREYVVKLKRDEVPRPACPAPGCTRRPQRRGSRWRKEVWDATGSALDPLEIVRFCCREHGWIPTSADCMLPYVRTVAAGVEDALEQYVTNGASAAVAAGSSVEGERCVRRWVNRLARFDLQSWVCRMLDGLRPDQADPGPRPARARAALWPTLARLRLLAHALRSQGFSVPHPLCFLWSTSRLPLAH